MDQEYELRLLQELALLSRDKLGQVPDIYCIFTYLLTHTATIYCGSPATSATCTFVYYPPIWFITRFAAKAPSAKLCPHGL
jgi:hypothetical protein